MFSVKNVTLNRRGIRVNGSLLLSKHHLVFSFVSKSCNGGSTPKEIWICYPIIEKMSKYRGSTWMKNSTGGTGSLSSNLGSNSGGFSGNSGVDNPPQMGEEQFDHYSASHIRLECKDFTFYSFDFINDTICSDVFLKLSSLITAPKITQDIQAFYAFEYRPNILEKNLRVNGWKVYDPVAEYKRQGLIQDGDPYWRLSKVNEDYKLSFSYPNHLIVPANISDNVLKHAAKFRSKLRIPAVVYKHRLNANGNVIARCAQPLVGLNLQNRSIQDEKLIGEIFNSQNIERHDKFPEDGDMYDQPQRNLIVDLRPLTNAMAQHALGAGTENIDNYRGYSNDKDLSSPERIPQRNVDKIFCNIDNIHIMRASLNKLVAILNDLDKFPTNKPDSYLGNTSLQQTLTKTQWLHRLSIILQSVDRITKSIHLNNTNVIIHCSDGWDRTSQVSALLQLCLDPYFRTIEGFMVLVEKEWASFGFKFATRGDHGGCIGAIIQTQTNEPNGNSNSEMNGSNVSLVSENSESEVKSDTGKSVTSFLQRAATHIKNTASAASNVATSSMDSETYDGIKPSSSTVYNGSNEKSPIFHQFLECVYQILRQHPSQFEFNSRFLKRLFYHYYSCQYGNFLLNSEREAKEVYKLAEKTVSVWDYFNSRPAEFTNQSYSPQPSEEDFGVLFFNYTDVKWWYELYGRYDEEMNGLSNSLDRKFAQMKMKQSSSPERI